MQVLTGVDQATFIKETAIDDFVLPTPDTFLNYESHWIAGSNRATFIATGEDTGGRYTLAELYVPSQFGPPAHIHTRENEWFYVTGGTLTFFFEDNQTLTATPGTLIFSPRYHPHQFINLGTEPATLLNVWQPSGIEGFFREAGDPVIPEAPFTPPSSPPNIERLIAVGRKYGFIEGFYLRPCSAESVSKPSGL